MTQMTYKKTVCSMGASFTEMFSWEEEVLDGGHTWLIFGLPSLVAEVPRS